MSNQSLSIKCRAGTVVAAWFIATTSALAAAPDFARDVRPIFERHCYACHGPEKQTSSYRLDVRDIAIKGGDSGEAAIVPHNSADSALVRHVSETDPDLRMPPGDSDVPPLSVEQIATLKAWIDAGPSWPNELAGSADDGRMAHWAWKPVRRPDVPLGDQHNPIDRLLLAEADESGTPLAPRADPRTLIRRLSYDLTGLPPTDEDVEAFAQDPSPAAYDALVGRLLDSPRYGERWGRKWLDVVRYADTAGDTADFPVMDAWRYRNWVIDAFNRDLPYDEFLRQQLAGDILSSGLPDERTADMITATGYWALARRFGADGDKDMYLTYDDAIDNLGKAVMGISIACARCHDHKYDPITSRDYYGIYGMLASTRFAYPGTELKPEPRDMVPIMSTAEKQLMSEWGSELSRLEGEISRCDEESKAQAKQADSLAPVLATLVAGEIAAKGAQEFALPTESPTITMRAGELLQLSVLMRGNNGGDATLVEFVVEEEGGKQRHWNATDDLVPDLHQAGEGVEHADAYGNAKTWLMYDLEDGSRLLDRYEPALFGTKGVPTWRRNDFPLVLVNTRTEPVKLQTITAPPRSLALHPGPRAGVALAWRAPADGVYRVHGRVAKIDPGGDGTAWRLDKRADLGDVFAANATIAAARKQAVAARDAHLAKQITPRLAYAVTEGDKPANAKILLRGDPEKLGAEVPRKNLDLFGGETVQEGSGREELASWLCRAEHPLTARVMVNRIWQGHFGRGIVGTPNDFGVKGQPPTHPALLDWLASEFVRQGWSIKAMHRLIVTSAAYQQQSGGADSAYPLPRRRLDAEEIRDSLLDLAGELDLTPGAAHPFKLTSGYRYSQHNPFAEFFDSKKRSVYLLTLRLRRHPMLGLFDGADPNAATPGRDVSTVPTQALYFLNDAFFHDCAALFARRITGEASDDRVRLEAACRMAFQRPATDAEQERAARFLAEVAPQFTEVPEPERRNAAWVALTRVLLGSNEFIYLD
ncbi:MAG: PSD1 and planctomycete cytochrome C domain-containing protein [Planctomycetia bacterium]|nr:PSD1 and planctomycete cytochrome C domain-containing protein [Planctomycetia bacterium]